MKTHQQFDFLTTFRKRNKKVTLPTLILKKNGDIVIDENVLVELFNENYINIVEISSGNKPSSLGNCDTTVDKIISKFTYQRSKN